MCHSTECRSSHFPVKNLSSKFTNSCANCHSRSCRSAECRGPLPSKNLVSVYNVLLTVIIRSFVLLNVVAGQPLSRGSIFCWNLTIMPSMPLKRIIFVKKMNRYKVIRCRGSLTERRGAEVPPTSVLRNIWRSLVVRIPFETVFLAQLSGEFLVRSYFVNLSFCGST